ncbi:MAG: rod shape-determining protein [Patescibacteria group bacterium]
MFSLTKRIGVDLGTVNSLVWVQGSGIVLNEPTVVAISLRDKRVVAVGTMAKNMLGRTPGNILTSRPLKNGVIADYSVTEAMLKFFLQKVMGRGMLFKPEVMVSVPAGSTQVERRAVLDATLAAGARRAYLIDEPLAAIIGAGIAIAEASGNMIVNIGGGVAEASVVSLGGVVASKGVRVGGSTLDEAIQKFVRKKYGVIIGDTTAEMVKTKIGSAMPKAEKAVEIQVKGRDATQGLPKEITITATDVFEAIQKPLYAVLDMVKKVLEEVPPELASDIIDKGLVMTGGTVMLDQLGPWISQEINIPVSLADEPLLCVIKGIGVVLDDLEVYRHVLREK